LVLAGVDVKFWPPGATGVLGAASACRMLNTFAANGL
jgi:hypothetical protein